MTSIPRNTNWGTAAEKIEQLVDTAIGAAVIEANNYTDDQVQALTGLDPEMVADLQATLDQYQAGQDATDTAVASVITSDGQARAALDVAYSPRGSGVARFLRRAANGENMTVGVIGDSIGEGYGLDNPTTERWSSLVLAALSARYGITLTENNQAVASYTAFRAFVGLKVSAVIESAPDLVFIQAFDKNDIGSDQFGQYAPGYPLEASTGAIERMLRLIREQAPLADIVLVGTNPYSSANTTGNALQRAKDDAVARLAALYGAEWVDGYAAFTALGTWDHLVPDGTHPNAAGNQVLADAVLAHFPDAPRHTFGMAATPARGAYRPEWVDTTVRTTAGQASFGYMGAASPGTRYDGRFVWANTGTWSTDGSGNDVTTTPGSYAEFTFYGTELIPMLDTSNAAAAVLDIYVDGEIVAANQAMNLGKNNGLNFVPVAVGLTPGWHTVRLTLKSGTLSINAAYALAAPQGQPSPTSGDVQTFTLSGVTGLSAAPTWTDLIDGTITLPEGWSSAMVLVTGRFGPRVWGPTTTVRRVQYELLIDGVSQGQVSMMLPKHDPEDGDNFFYMLVPVGGAAAISGNAPVVMRARVVSTDTDRVSAFNGHLTAALVRTG